MSRTRGTKPVVLSDYDHTQKLTFTAWVNSYLRKNGERMEDLTEFADGVTLLSFVRILTGKEVNGGKYTAAPRIRIQIVENIQLALRHVEEEGVRVTCDPDNFFAGTAADVRMVLGFLWLLICKYQINAAVDDALTLAADRAADAPAPAPSSLADRMARRRSKTVGSGGLAPVAEDGESDGGASSGGGGGRARGATLAVPRSRDRAVSLSQSMAGTQSLLEWVATELEKYSIAITNFGSCFQDGRAFCALTELAVGSASFNYAEMEFDDPVRAMSNAFATADMELDIPQLLVPEALVKAPDPHSIMTYVSYFRANLAAARRAKRAAMVDEANAAFASAVAAERSPTRAPTPPEAPVVSGMVSEEEADGRVKAAVEANAAVAAAAAKEAAAEARAVQLALLSEKEAMARKIAELQNALREEKAAHVASNDAADAKIKALKSTLGATEAALEPLESAKAELESELENCATREAGLRDSLAVVEAALDAKTKAAAAAQITIIDLESELESANETVASLTAKAEGMKAELSLSQSAISQAQAASKQAQASSEMTLLEAQTRVTELETSLEQYRAALVEKSKGKKALKEALIAERKKNSELGEQVEAIRTAAEKYKAKLKVSKKLLKTAQEKANSVKAKNRLLGERLVEVKSKSKAEKLKAKENEIKTIADRETKVKGAVMGELERQRMEMLRKLAQAKYQRSATPTTSRPSTPGSGRRSSLASGSLLSVTPPPAARRRSSLVPDSP